MSDVSPYLSDLAADVAVRFGAVPNELELHSVGENAVFRLQTTEGISLCLRLHRRGGFSVPVRLAELQWLQALSEQTQLWIPKPAGAGTSLLSIADPGGRWESATLLTWLDGRAPTAPFTADHQQALGTVLATLHDHASERPEIQNLA
ncbi:MAG: hypothetical protein AAGC55_11160, partial [Myxococcota bacterium]